MSEKRAELLLACVIIARSTSFVFNKLGLGTMTAFNLRCWRCCFGNDCVISRGAP